MRIISNGSVKLIYSALLGQGVKTEESSNVEGSKGLLWFQRANQTSEGSNFVKRKVGPGENVGTQKGFAFVE